MSSMEDRMWTAMKRLLPAEWKASMKRRMFVVQDMRARLANLKRAGFTPGGAIDGGAYRGDWSQEFWAVWPEVPVLLVEPQPDCARGLATVAARVPGSEVVQVALSDRPGQVRFRLGESNSAIAGEADGSPSITVETDTLDRLLARRPGFSPNLLKLDLQGFELHALRGATSVMDRFEVVVMEVSILRIGEVPILHEVIEFMEAAGTRLYDVIPQYYRPLDGALWQVDAFFVRRESPLLASREWGPRDDGPAGR